MTNQKFDNLDKCQLDWTLESIFPELFEWFLPQDIDSIELLCKKDIVNSWQNLDF